MVFPDICRIFQKIYIWYQLTLDVSNSTSFLTVTYLTQWSRLQKSSQESQQQSLNLDLKVYIFNTRWRFLKFCNFSWKSADSSTNQNKDQDFASYPHNRGRLKANLLQSDLKLCICLNTNILCAPSLVKLQENHHLISTYICNLLILSQCSKTQKVVCWIVKSSQNFNLPATLKHCVLVTTICTFWTI